MYKLLTEEARQKAKREYAIRRVIVMLELLILVVAAGIIGILPSYLLSNVRQTEVLERTRIIDSSSQKVDEEGLHKWLIDTNRKLDILAPSLDSDRPSDFIGKVLDEKINGIRLTGFSWIKAKNKITLSVNGIASSRQNVITFQDRINASEHFTEVVLPVSNLAKDTNIDFQLKFSPVQASTSTKP